MDRLSRWMDLLDMKLKHKMYIISWIGNFAGDTEPFLHCADRILEQLRQDKDPDPNILDLIDQVVALRVIDIARKGLDYMDDVAYWRDKLEK